MFTQMQNAAQQAGADMSTNRDALIPMQAYLHAAQREAERLGVALDANTQMMIDQSQELGIWQEEGPTATELMLQGVNSMVDAVNRLINALIAFHDRPLGSKPFVVTRNATLRTGAMTAREWLPPLVPS